MRSVNDPYIAVIGSIYDVKSCSLICEGKVVVANIGCRIFSMLIVLMGFCHAFCLHYHSEVREALEMLQEKMFGIVEGKKKSTAYLNMSRAISCISSKKNVTLHTQEEEEADLNISIDDDQTQLTCEWEPFGDP